MNNCQLLLNVSLFRIYISALLPVFVAVCLRWNDFILTYKGYIKYNHVCYLFTDA